MPADVKKQVELEVSKLVLVIQSDMSGLKDSLQQALKQPFESAEKEADEYKKERIKQFENNIFILLAYSAPSLAARLCVR